MLKSYDQFTEKLPSQPSPRQLITSLKSFNLLDGEILLYFCQQDSKYQELSTKLQLFLTKFHDLQTLSFQYELSSNINRGIKRKRESHQEKEYVGYCTFKSNEPVDIECFLDNLQQFQHLNRLKLIADDITLCHTLKYMVDEALNSLNINLLSSSHALHFADNALCHVTPLYAFTATGPSTDLNFMTKTDSYRKALLLKYYFCKLQATLQDMISGFGQFKGGP